MKIVDMQMQRYSFSDFLLLTIFQDLDSNLLSHILFNKYEKIQNGWDYSEGFLVAFSYNIRTFYTIYFIMKTSLLIDMINSYIIQHLSL